MQSSAQMIRKLPSNPAECVILLWGGYPPYTTVNVWVAKWRWRKYCKSVFSRCPWWWLRKLGIKYWVQVKSMSVPEYREWAEENEGISAKQVARKESYDV